MDRQFIPHSHAPYRCGDNKSFSDLALMNYTVMDLAVPFVMAALESIEFDPKAKRAFTIADYGTADGGTSMALISQIIGKIKEKYGDNQEVQVNYEDQPNADYNALFLRLHGLKKANTPSFQLKHKHIFTAACGTSFFSQCFPTESVHLGYCATALHWLSHRPCHLKSSLLWAFSTDETEKKAYAEVAKKDWEIFLQHRAKELCHGAYLVLANPGISVDGQFSGNTFRVKQSRHRNFYKYWKQMVKDGIITQNEFENTSFISYCRTEEEYSAPFMNEESVACKAGLKLQTVQTIHIPCPHNLAWINLSESEKDDEEERRKYAQRFIDYARSWSNSTFMSGLSNSRPEEEKCQIVDEFFSRYEKDVIKAPEEHAADFVHVFMIIKKETTQYIH